MSTVRIGVVAIWVIFEMVLKVRRKVPLKNYRIFLRRRVFVDRMHAFPMNARIAVYFVVQQLRLVGGCE